MYAIRFLAEMVGLYHRIELDGYRFLFPVFAASVFLFYFLLSCKMLP